jgi:hypothetical protein
MFDVVSGNCQTKYFKTFYDNCKVLTLQDLRYDAYKLVGLVVHPCFVIFADFLTSIKEST